VQGHPDSIAYFSTCTGHLDGAFHVGSEQYALHPALSFDSLTADKNAAEVWCCGMWL